MHLTAARVYVPRATGGSGDGISPPSLAGEDASGCAD